MSRKIALHVWDVGSIETTYACGAEPGQPAICAVISSLHLPDVLRLDRSSERICKRCRGVVGERIRSVANAMNRYEPPRGRSGSAGDR